MSQSMESPPSTARNVTQKQMRELLRSTNITPSMREHAALCQCEAILELNGQRYIATAEESYPVYTAQQTGASSVASASTPIAAAPAPGSTGDIGDAIVRDLAKAAG